ncbi:hypothetical protein ACFQ48_07445 [Hymenobacter caeli]|uniref:Uncharacterized protein n=1 Tax=Hymenobacter caeli TaxID=2735894 RepID=A0ABX2FNQ6_9BACT|nr:hypothetical protein [Hymenobacter caeli]NRT18077.1 hypothetical protein [Hymenobacter caeli]
MLLVIISLAGLCRLGFEVASRCRASAALGPVNPVVGDASFVARFGRGPTDETPDVLRIQTHLAYAEQRLRQCTPEALPAALRQRRAHLLDLLHAYWQAGVFPRNAAPDGQRHPCFIDGAGRICAVGYLVEQTAGRAAAECINRRFQYSNLLDMRDDALGRWVAQSGLSLADCALIQPTYGPVYTPVASGNNIPNGYGTASAVLGGLNLSALALSSSDAGRQAGRWLPWLTMASGTTQLVLGATRFPAAPEARINGTPPTNESQKILSMANLGVGTATVLFGAWNLLHRPATTAQGPRTSWNVGPAPAGVGQHADGMSLFLARRF